MPPKKPAPPKAEQAKKAKAVEDKTFGLKNKNKSKTVQKYVQNLQQSVQPNRNPRTQPDQKELQKKKREEEKEREKELNELFKVAITQPKVPVGVDPKSIVCEYFRRGQCAKGFKCKFSHDLSVERKGEKIDLYSDARDGEDEDTMEDWDQAKLETVVNAKGGEYANQNKTTEIVCKHFLDAVERKLYGWFWACPNGGKECKYRHALPPGYVLKSQMRTLLEEEAANAISVEEAIESDRAKLSTSTPLTGELFAEWKRKKQEKKDADQAKNRADRAKMDRLSGRELFLQDSSLFIDDAEAMDGYEREEQQGLLLQEENSKKGGAGTSAGKENGQRSLELPADEAGPSTSGAGAAAWDEQDEEELFGDDDDDLDEDELEELEAGLAIKASLEDG